MKVRTDPTVNAGGSPALSQQKGKDAGTLNLWSAESSATLLRKSTAALGAMVSDNSTVQDMVEELLDQYEIEVEL